MTDTILMMVLSGSGSTADGSMLTWASLSISPTGVSVIGVDDCAAAAAGEHPPSGLLNEVMLCPLKSSISVALLGVASWLLSKDVSASNLLKSKGDEEVDPETLG